MMLDTLESSEINNERLAASSAYASWSAGGLLTTVIAADAGATGDWSWIFTLL